MSTKEKIYVGVEKPFILNNTDSFWMVVSGEVNVFYVKVDEEGEYLSALKYLYSAKKGDLLFSLRSPESKNNTRLIVFSNEATLLCINKNKLITIDPFFLTNMINKWILKTSFELNLHNAPKTYYALDNYNNLFLDQNTIAYHQTDKLGSLIHNFFFRTKTINLMMSLISHFLYLINYG
jgi:ATP-binding cassette subfamily C protein